MLTSQPAADPDLTSGAAATLENGDEIGIGGARFIFRATFGLGPTITG